MAAGWLNWLAGHSPQEGSGKQTGYGIRSGVVSSNIDLLKQGKVLVRLPDLGIEVWARLCAPGAGASTGLFFAPNIGDEVLLAFDLHHPSSSYVLGGLWGTRKTPPVSNPVLSASTRVFQTGVAPSPGVPPLLSHQVEFDDLKQSLTITTSTKQKIAIDPTSIEVSTTGGTVSIKMDLKKQSVTISAPLSISLESKGEIKLSATSITIDGKIMTTITGGKVFIN